MALGLSSVLSQRSNEGEHGRALYLLAVLLIEQSSLIARIKKDVESEVDLLSARE